MTLQSHEYMGVVATCLINNGMFCGWVYEYGCNPMSIWELLLLENSIFTLKGEIRQMLQSHEYMGVVATLIALMVN